MLIKASELTGAALDWAVAKCEDVPVGTPDFVWAYCASTSNYSSNWELGGEIIDREKITIIYVDPTDAKPLGSGDFWTADIPFAEIGYTAQTPLIAAMRCYVASKLGASIEVPEYLTC